MKFTRREFLDIRRHGFVRVAVLVPPVRVAYPMANAKLHLTFIRNAAELGAMYALCPELGLTGYSCGDLFRSDQLLEAAEHALGWLMKETEQCGILVSVGMPVRVHGTLYNCAVTFCGNEILAIAPKAYPPEYAEFYELRFFAQASDAIHKTVSLLEQKDIPFGTDLLLCSEWYPDFVLHTEVCEDIWVPISPSAHAALAGATVLANLSASNTTIGKSEYRQILVQASSGKNNAVQMYSAAGFGESTTDHAWDGDGYIAERGTVLAKCDRFHLEGEIIVQDVDVSLMMKERMRQSSFQQNASDNRKEFRSVEIPSCFYEDQWNERHEEFIRTIDPHPFVPSNLSERDVRCRETFMIQATSLTRRLDDLPKDKQKVVIGISGGQDSTHALLVAAHAMDILGLTRTNIIGVTMPGFGTTDRTYKNACALMKAVGAVFREISIKDLAQQTFTDIGYDASKKDVVYENIQAWSRKHVLFSIAAMEGGIVLGTGDLTELLVGWCTHGGDHLSHYNINAGVPKTLISYLIQWASDTIFVQEKDVQAVLHDILNTPVSPELLPPSESGEILQKSEDSIGPNELTDFFGYYFVRFGMRPLKVARLAYAAFGEKYSLAVIKKWLAVFLRRFFANQFKRSCTPDGPKVGLLALSPRGDWRMPSDANATAYLADMDLIPNEEDM